MKNKYFKIEANSYMGFNFMRGKAVILVQFLWFTLWIYTRQSREVDSALQTEEWRSGIMKEHRSFRERITGRSQKKQEKHKTRWLMKLSR